MLNVAGDIIRDDRVTCVQKMVYSPYTPNYGNSQLIRIAIQSQNAYVLPHGSSIYIECEVVHSAPAAGAGAPVVHPNLIPNCAAFLFDSIRYELNGVEIDSCKNVGITSFIKGTASLTPGESHGLNASTWNIAGGNTPRKISINIPLKLYLGFAEDNTLVVLNAKHELIMTRSLNDRNCFNGPADTAKINIEKIQWRMPHIRVDDHKQLKLLKQINSNTPISMAYRSWELYEYPSLPLTNRHVWPVKTSGHLTRPRYVLLAFQSN